MIYLILLYILPVLLLWACAGWIFLNPDHPKFSRVYNDPHIKLHFAEVFNEVPTKDKLAGSLALGTCILACIPILNILSIAAFIQLK